MKNWHWGFVPHKETRKPNLNHRKRTLNDEVIGDQSWLIDGQTYRLKTIQTTRRMDHSADVMMTLFDDVMMTSAPRQQKKEIYSHLRYFADVMKYDMFIYFRINF